MGFDVQGSIKCGTALVPDLKAALEDYHGVLGLNVAERGEISPDLAAGWGTPAVAGCPYAVLQPNSGAASFVRLIESSLPPDFKPTTTYGWAAFEFTVEDVFGWPKRLRGSGFKIVGPPQELEGLPYFVPMQALGTGREMVYLNEVREDTPSSDLPKAQSPVDHIFIVILAAPDREAAVEWYKSRLGFAAGDTYVLEYTMINDAFGLPAGTTSALTMVQNGRLPIVEVDDYPEEAKPRPRGDGMLPPGNSMVTLAAHDLGALDLDWIRPPVQREGALYEGRRAGTVTGPAGELLELLETG